MGKKKKRRRFFSENLGLRTDQTLRLCLTPSLLLQAAQALLLPPARLLSLLVLPALVEVLHHHPHEHVEHKEADDEEEGDEVEEHPGVVVGYRLEVGIEQKQWISWMGSSMEMMGVGPALVIGCREGRGGLWKSGEWAGKSWGYRQGSWWLADWILASPGD